VRLCSPLDVFGDDSRARPARTNRVAVGVTGFVFEIDVIDREAR
jgi:hypothetical protein